MVTSPPVSGSHLLEASVPLLGWSCYLSLSSAVSEARRCLRRARSLHIRRSRASTVYEAWRCLSPLQPRHSAASTLQLTGKNIFLCKKTMMTGVPQKASSKRDMVPAVFPPKIHINCHCASAHYMRMYVECVGMRPGPYILVEPLWPLLRHPTAPVLTVSFSWKMPSSLHIRLYLAGMQHAKSAKTTQRKTGRGRGVRHKWKSRTLSYGQKSVEISRNQLEISEKVEIRMQIAVHALLFCSVSLRSLQKTAAISSTSPPFSLEPRPHPLIMWERGLVSIDTFLGPSSWKRDLKWDCRTAN